MLQFISEGRIVPPAVVQFYLYCVYVFAFSAHPLLLLSFLFLLSLLVGSKLPPLIMMRSFISILSSDERGLRRPLHRPLHSCVKKKARIPLSPRSSWVRS